MSYGTTSSHAAQVRSICTALMGPTGVEQYYSDPLKQSNSSGVDLLGTYPGKIWNAGYLFSVQASWLDKFETRVTPSAPTLDWTGAATGTTTISDTADQYMFGLSGGMRFGENGQYFVRHGIDNLLNEQPETTGRDLNPADPSTGAGQTNSQFCDVLGHRLHADMPVQFCYPGNCLQDAAENLRALPGAFFLVIRLRCSAGDNASG